MDPLAHPNVGRVPIKLLFLYLHVIVKVLYGPESLPISASQYRESLY